MVVQAPSAARPKSALSRALAAARLVRRSLLARGDQIAGIPEQPAQAREGGRGFALYPAPADVVMFGDSLFMFGNWPGLLPGVRVVAQAINGDLTRWALQRVNGVVATRPRLAITLLGNNDAIARIAPAETLANYAEIGGTLEKAGIRPLFVSPLLTASEDENHRINPLIGGLRALCAARGWTFVDANAALTMADRCDLRHLRAEAYTKLAAALRPYVEAGCRPA